MSLHSVPKIHALACQSDSRNGRGGGGPEGPELPAPTLARLILGSRGNYRVVSYVKGQPWEDVL